MNRRLLTKALALAPLSCQVTAEAWAAQSPKTTQPSDPNRPFRTVNVSEDSRRVLFFFDFACPYCAVYHGPLMNFQATAPKQIQTLMVPVVNTSDLARKNEQVIAAKCFYAAQELGSREQVSTFVSTVYQLYPVTRSLLDKTMWIRAAKEARLNLSRFAEATKSGNNDQQVMFAARKTLIYDLRATPSVGIGGKYVLTPEDVHGDQSMFFNILNGLTSEIL